MPMTDEDAALEAVSSFADLTPEQQLTAQSINSILLDGEPFVDVHVLFAHYNVLYFRNLLQPSVQVLWSPRLTLCAGICELSKDPSTGKLTRIRLKLSTPLLQYRPRSDTINTLLHEAIHAYFFITTSWRHARGDDGTGHGIGFQMLADAINNHGSYHITIFHTFHDEVESFRTHVWQCNGPCKTQPPYFGLVKRSMNRPPGKSDNWFAKHEAECGGTYEKVQEPAPTKKQLDSMTAKERAGRQKNKLDGWVTAGSKRRAVPEAESSALPINVDDENESPKVARPGQRSALELVVDDVVRPESSVSKKRPRIDDDVALVVSKTLLVECPICLLQVAESIINEHLDVVHA